MQSDFSVAAERIWARMVTQQQEAVERQLHAHAAGREFAEHLLQFTAIRAEHDRIYREVAFPSAEERTAMAKDVHEALITVAQEQGGKSREDAENYLNELRKAKRYQKDVY